MTIIIESPHFKISDSLTEFVREKVAKLEKLSRSIVCVEVNLRREGSGRQETKVCAIILSQKGKDYVVKNNSASFEDAVSEAVDLMMRRLRRKKQERLSARIRHNKGLAPGVEDVDSELLRLRGGGGPA
jgi:putative sigma-54 modulation protein